MVFIVGGTFLSWKILPKKMYLDCSTGVCWRHVVFMVLISLLMEFNWFGHFGALYFSFYLVGLVWWFLVLFWIYLFCSIFLFARGFLGSGRIFFGFGRWKQLYFPFSLTSLTLFPSYHLLLFTPSRINSFDLFCIINISCPNSHCSSASFSVSATIHPNFH